LRYVRRPPRSVVDFRCAFAVAEELYAPPFWQAPAMPMPRQREARPSSPMLLPDMKALDTVQTKKAVSKRDVIFSRLSRATGVFHGQRGMPAVGSAQAEA